MTKIVKLALNNIGINVVDSGEERSKVETTVIRPCLKVLDDHTHLFTRNTKAAVYGMQVDAVQVFLNFIFLTVYL